MTASGHFRSKFVFSSFFCQQYGVGMNILKTKRSFLITPKVIANSSSRCTQNLCKFIHSLSFDVLLVYLCINDPRELCDRYPQLTTEHCSEMWSGTKCSSYSLHIKQLVFYFRFTHFRFTISDFQLMWDRLGPSMSQISQIV